MCRVGLVHRILADPLAPVQIGGGRQSCVGVGGVAGEQPDAAGAGVGEMVEETEDGRLVIVVDPAGDRQGAAGPAVGDDGDAVPDELGDDGVAVGGVDDDGAVQGDVGPHVVAGGRGEDDQRIAAGQGRGGGGSGHLGEVREFGEGERFIPVRGHGQAEEARLAGTEGAGGCGRAVAQPVGHLADMATGGIRKPALAVERVGDSRDRHTGCGGHVPDARPPQPATG